jgi:hypothetical protein
MMILGGVFEDDFEVLFWAIFQVRHLLMDCVPVYVSDHRELVFERFCQIPCAMPCWLKQDLLNDVLGHFLTGAILHVLLAMIFGAVLAVGPLFAVLRKRICLVYSVFALLLDANFTGQPNATGVCRIHSQQRRLPG